MTVRIELSEEQASALNAKASAEGLTLEAWFRKLAAMDMVPRPRKGRYSLAELMDQCDVNASVSPEERAWLDEPSVGREAL